MAENNNNTFDIPSVDNSQTDSQPKKRTRTRTASTSKQASATNIPSQVMEDIFNKIRNDIENSSISIINQFKSEVSQLHSTISSQSAEISRLTKQLSVVMSYLELTDTDQAIASSSTSAPPVIGEQSMSSSSSPAASQDAMDDSTPFTVVVAKNKRLQPTARKAAITAVYIEQNDKKRRSSSVIISGLPPNTAPGAPDDRQLVLGFCQVELGIFPDIVAIKRLGKERPDRVQPILVTCRSEETAKRLTTMAPSLRHSSNEYVRSRVYVNANLTVAEAAAAFQLRERRRQAEAAKQNKTQQTTTRQPLTTTSGSTSGPSSNAYVHGPITQHPLTAEQTPAQSSTLMTTANMQQPYASSVSLTNFVHPVSAFTPR